MRVAGEGAYSRTAPRLLCAGERRDEQPDEGQTLWLEDRETDS